MNVSHFDTILHKIYDFVADAIGKCVICAWNSVLMRDPCIFYGFHARSVHSPSSPAQTKTPASLPAGLIYCDIGQMSQK